LASAYVFPFSYESIVATVLLISTALGRCVYFRFATYSHQRFAGCGQTRRAGSDPVEAPLSIHKTPPVRAWHC
jgi:hypothetical protein